MKKGGFLRNVLDTIRSNQANQSAGSGSNSGNDANLRQFGGQLKAQHFSVGPVARHGFPESPTALAFDPVQKIAAIGTKTGALRVFGRPGVDVWAQHKPEFAVTHIRFVINQGAIITVTADESIHLWSLRGPHLRLQHSQQSAAASPLPAQAASPAPPGPPSTASQQQQQSVGGNQQGAGQLHHQRHSDSGAQPGDPDYLADQLSSSSPTYDKSKQYPRQPEILHTLKFQREHITCLHQTLMSKWLYIGTERGNVHVANVETFELSGYSIAWNKAIELCRKTHPGSIIHISECPQDTNKLLIGYESGCIVLWDLKGKSAEGRYYHTENLLWLAWHYEGKQFVAAHGDGSLVTWQTRSNARPVNILYPHAKTPTAQAAAAATADQGGGSSEQFQQFQQQQQQSFVARALNNELYRPINKVDWKVSKSSEQFLLFSGGLPYDGLEGQPAATSASPLFQQRAAAAAAIQARAASVQPTTTSQQQQQQFLKASSVSHNPSPTSPSISPMNPLASSSNNGDPAARSTKQQQQPSQMGTTAAATASHKERKSLRSTSLTVMYGRSITVLEMDETIIDFITICDNSPYENDTSDPLAVIILLSNDLILIDLTSAGYPSFDSPYPSANLNESPVTCVQYLAHCSSDLIPFLYSTSQNVVSRAPKKGFSDKEWPINGGEWGQQMQSYPELVLTGHADGTIKFWDMSGVNFDLISKIKTAKFFERPNKLRNSTIMAHSQAIALLSGAVRPSRPIATQPIGSAATNSGAAAAMATTTTPTIDQLAAGQSQDLEGSGHHQQAAAAATNEFTDENPFAIERIEYYPASKNLVIAGALAQVIQFRVNKREAQLSPASAEIATILVEPTQSDSINQPMGPPMQPQQQLQPQKQQHSVLKVRNPLASGAAAGSSSGGSSCSSSGSSRARSSGFQAELICLTPSLLVPSGADFSAAAAAGAANSVARHYYCVAPPKVTALALQAAHNILAYAHENGIVLVDIIQKCVIMSANLSDLYGGASMMQSNRDISIQPFATSSILQHHYQASAAAAAAAAAVGSPPRSGELAFCNPPSSANNSAGLAALAPDNGPTSRGESDQQQTATDNGENGPPNNSSSASSNNGPDLHKSALRSSNEPTGSNQQPKSRFTANSAFQRQLSTTALQTAAAAAAAAADGSPARSAHASPGGVASGPRLFQRQMTASQLFNHSSSMSAAGGQAQASGDQAGLSNKQRAAALLASARAGGNSELGGSSFCLSGAGQTTASAATTATTTTRPASSSGGGGLGLGSGFRQSAASGAGDGSDGAKKAGKKRIISRMLSISAIHTTATSSSSSSSMAAAAAADQAIGSNGSLANSAALLHNGTAANSNASNATNGSGATTTMTSACDQVSDKIDSSFTRSRSSSTSSLTPALDGQQQQQSGESVLCLCFLDWSQAMAASAAAAAATAANAGAAPSQAASSNSGSSSSSSSGSAALGAGAAGTGQGGGAGGAGSAAGHQAASSSSASAGNKSLGSPAVADNSTGQLALWLGTSHGSVLLVHLQMPDSEDNRVLQLQSVNAEPIPRASIKLPGSILCLASFTSELQLAASNAPPGGQSSSPMAAGAASQSSSVESDSVLLVGSAGATSQQHHHHHHHQHPAGSNTSAQSSFDSQKQAKVYQIPSQAKASQQQQQQHHNHRHHETGKPAAAAAAASSASQVESSALGKLLTNKANCISKLDISDSSFACRSALVQMRQPDESCLVSYLATGNIMVHSLPQLRPLLDADFVPYSNPRIGSSMCFSRNGHCLFQPSPSEISKFTISAQYRALVNEMTGLLHVARDMPEMPRANFFKSLFSAATSSAASKQSDRDELFGECSAGKPTRGVAKHFSSTAAAGASGLEKLKGAAAGTMGHDLRVAREGLDERGEKLSEMEDKTLQMMNQSESYAQAAHQLAQKFKDKKWYQF